MENRSTLDSIISILEQNSRATVEQPNYQSSQKAKKGYSISEQLSALKDAYAQNNIRQCAFLICLISTVDAYTQKRGIRKILYTDNLVLPNPLSYTVDEDEVKKVKRILIATVEQIKFIQKRGSSISSLNNILTGISDQIIQIYRYYDVIYQNRQMNERLLISQPLLKEPLAVIMRSSLVFFQDQARLARNIQQKQWDSQAFVTGMESRVSNLNSDMFSSVKASLKDNFEESIEAMDALFRYIYFLKPDDFNDLNSWCKNFLPPYESVAFQHLTLLSLNDVLYTMLESRFRYSDATITPIRDANNVDGIAIHIGNLDRYKIHVAATLRREHNAFFHAGVATVFQKYLSTSENESNSLLQRVSERLQIDDIESFHIDSDEYRKLAKTLEPILFALRANSKEYYFKRKFSNITVDGYLKTYTFLFIFSKIYYTTALRHFDESKINTYPALVPFINIQYLYLEFSNLHPELSFKQAKKLINCFVFDNKISKDKYKGDLFTRPLIKVNPEKILLSEALIDQMNLERNIEVLLESNRVDISPVGKEMERRIIEELSSVEELLVNTAPVVFHAYDAKDVEFDCIAIFGNFLLLIEMKSLYTPYSDFDLFKRRKPIREGIEQVKRRADIVKYDWEKIRKSVNIPLPSQPYPEEKIIKIVCADIGDFTSLEIDGVFITDESTLIKYFKNSYIQGFFSDQSSIQPFQKKTLWESGKPTVQEFIAYLRAPETVTFILESMETSYNPILRHENCDGIVFENISIKYDPWARLEGAIVYEKLTDQSENE